jgi:hypothetical protein
MKITQDIFKEGDFIQEGVSPSKDVLLLACTVGDDYHNSKNRILVLKNESWLDFFTSGEAVLSIDATKTGMAYVLGENGTIVQFDWRSETQDSLKTSRVLYVNSSVPNLGPLRRVRIIDDGHIVCCGSVGQVYFLQNDQFKALPTLSINDEEQTIEDIAGASFNNIMAVTSEGYGAWFNGESWQILDLPTNAGLTSIISIGDGLFAISGKNGVLITGNGDSWSAREAPHMDRTYWGIAAKNSYIYAAHLGGIDVFHKNRVESMGIPDSEGCEFTTLTHGPNGVWSLAGQTIGLIDNNKWRTFISNPL